MFSSFDVKDFRCFRELHVEGLERINLITGRNNVGKTALLEALHLHCLPNKPHLWIKIHKLRGIDEPMDAFEEVGRWLFFGGDSGKRIEIGSTDNHQQTRLTSARMLDPQSSRQLFPEIEAQIASAFRTDIGRSEAPRLIVNYSRGGQEVATFAAFPQGIGYQSIKDELDERPNMLLANLHSDHDRDVANFSRLEAGKRLEEVLVPLREFESRLQRLSLLPFAGRTVIHGDVEGLDRLVPISLIGEGMRRLLSIVLAIANVSGGVLFVDEIESGLHYSVMERVWRTVAAAARRADVQVFATTHSWECLRAAHESFSEAQIYDFRMHRLDRVDDRIEAVTYDREKIETSLALGLEVR